MPTCFIIMPISTPLDADYEDSNHFKHVLTHLFVPAVSKAGFTPILPIAKGGEIIIAEIIQHLAVADMVLCDMSCHNPNVFYELGIRTALNKPAALVKDSITPRIPFDTAAINVEEYPAKLRPWNIDDACALVAEHVKNAFEKSLGKNSAWRYFGVTEQAEFQPGSATPEDKLEVILSKIDELGKPRAAAVAKPPVVLNTIRDYVQSGIAGKLIGEWMIYGGHSYEIRRVELSKASLIVGNASVERRMSLSDPEVLDAELLPF